MVDAEVECHQSNVFHSGGALLRIFLKEVSVNNFGVGSPPPVLLLILPSYHDIRHKGVIVRIFASDNERHRQTFAKRALHLGCCSHGWSSPPPWWISKTLLERVEGTSPFMFGITVSNYLYSALISLSSFMSMTCLIIRKEGFRRTGISQQSWVRSKFVFIFYIPEPYLD